MIVRLSLILLILSFSLVAQDANYRWSVAAVVAANAADAATSWGVREGNPILGSQFGYRSLLIKSALTTGMLAAERPAIRHGYLKERHCAWINWAVAGGIGFVAYRNFRLR